MGLLRLSLLFSTALRNFVRSCQTLNLAVQSVDVSATVVKQISKAGEAATKVCGSFDHIL